MEKFSRSKSSRENPAVMQPNSMHDLRSYSTSDYNPGGRMSDYNFSKSEVKIKKGSNNNNNNNRSKIASASSNSTKNWNFNMDPELQRKKRVAGYKAYAVEGKMKSTFRKSFRWVKDIVHGLW